MFEQPLALEEGLILRTAKVLAVHSDAGLLVDERIERAAELAVSLGLIDGRDAVLSPVVEGNHNGTWAERNSGGHYASECSWTIGGGCVVESMLVARTRILRLVIYLQRRRQSRARQVSWSYAPSGGDRAGCKTQQRKHS